MTVSYYTGNINLGADQLKTHQLHTDTLLLIRLQQRFSSYCNKHASVATVLWDETSSSPRTDVKLFDSKEAQAVLFCKCCIKCQISYTENVMVVFGLFSRQPVFQSVQ